MRRRAVGYDREGGGGESGVGMDGRGEEGGRIPLNCWPRDLSQNRNNRLSFSQCLLEMTGRRRAKRSGNVWRLTKNICSFDLYTVALAIVCAGSTLYKTAERRAPLRSPGPPRDTCRGGGGVGRRPVVIEVRKREDGSGGTRRHGYRLIRRMSHQFPRLAV